MKKSWMYFVFLFLLGSPFFNACSKDMGDLEKITNLEPTGEIIHESKLDASISNDSISVSSDSMEELVQDNSGSKDVVSFEKPTSDISLSSYPSKWLQYIRSFGGKDTESLGHAKSTAVDAQGNAYLVGTFTGTMEVGTAMFASKGYSDVFVVKLNSEGDMVWSISFGGGKTEEGNAIALDSQGNSYITGSFGGSMQVGSNVLVAKGTREAFVIKLDPQGKVVWAVSPSAGWSTAGVFISVDNQGNSYMVGTFKETIQIGASILTSKGGEDIIVAKLDSQGKFVWVTSLGGKEYDFATSVVMDNQNNLYLTGYFKKSIDFASTTLTSEGYEDIFVTKLDGQGKVVWARSFGGTAFERAESIALDAQGNLYLLGTFSETLELGTKKLSVYGTFRDIFVAKLDNQGKVIWAHSFEGAGTDGGKSITLDAQGNIYLTGTFMERIRFGKSILLSENKQGNFVAKLDSLGKIVWAISCAVENNSAFTSVALDKQGYVYLFGFFRYSMEWGGATLVSKGGYDIFIAKLNQQEDTPPCKIDSHCPLLHHCEQGVCSKNQSIGCDVLPQNVWCESSQSAGGYCVEKNGSLHLVSGSACISSESCSWGKCRATCQKDVDCTDQKVCMEGYCLSKADNKLLGQPLLTRPELFLHSTTHIQKNGFFYLAGHFVESIQFTSTQSIAPKGNKDLFVAQLDTQGKMIWVTSLFGTGSLSLGSMFVDSQNNVYLLGGFSNTLQVGTQTLTAQKYEDIFIVKYDKQGKMVWTTSLGGTGYDSGTSLFVDSQGHIYIAGSFQETINIGNTTLTSLGNSDAFAAKLDGQGKVLWATAFRGKANEYSQVVSVDSQGNMHITGRFGGTLQVGNDSLKSKGYDDVFVVKLDTQGKVLWSSVLGGTSDRLVGAMVLDSKGNIYLAGRFMDTMQVGSNTLVSKGSWDVFVAKLDAQGKELWGVSFGGTSIDTVYSMALDSQENVHLLGSFFQTIQVGSNTLTSKGGLDTFFVKLDALGKTMKSFSLGGAKDDLPSSLSVNQAGQVFISTIFGLYWMVP